MTTKTMLQVVGEVFDMVVGPPTLADDQALDRIAALFAGGPPDGLRASTEALEEVARLVRLTGRDVGPQFDDEGTGP